MSGDYQDFLASKSKTFAGTGIEVAAEELHPSLFGFQRKLVQWALRKGRCALWTTTGSGKTAMSLEWARRIADRALILAPLAVAQQTVREGERLGIPVTYARSQAQTAPFGITITNYEMLRHFDAAAFPAVVLDESSILANFSGTVKGELVETFRQTPYKLCCTATPAPNDTVELCNHADFLGIMTPADMLSRFFISKGDDAKSDRFRLKRHAHEPFFRWLSSWAMAMNLPSDLGFEDGPFILPELSIRPVFVDTDWRPDGALFLTTLKGITERSAARRATVGVRVAETVRLVRESWQVPAQNTGARITQRIESSDSPTNERHTIATPKSARHRSADGVKTGEVRRSEPTPVSITAPTPNNTEHAEPPTSSSATASMSPSSSSSLKRKAGVAEFVAPLREMGDDSTSTMITRPAQSAASSAIPATCSSEDSATMPDSYATMAKSLPQSISKEAWVIWCGLDSEQRELEAAFGADAISVYGSLSPEEKTKRLIAWLEGERPILLTKVRVAGYGLNMQRCARMAFTGMSDSWQDYYQALRRCWRFGQTRPVHAYLVLSTVEEDIYNNVMRKETESLALQRDLVAAVARYEQEELAALPSTEPYQPGRRMRVPDWLRTEAGELMEVAG